MEYKIVAAKTVDSMATIQYLTPYTGVALAQRFFFFNKCSSSSMLALLFFSFFYSLSPFYQIFNNLSLSSIFNKHCLCGQIRFLLLTPLQS